MRRSSLFAAAVAAVMGLSGSAQAEPTEITFWHAMGGRLGEVVDQITAEFNASQSDVKLTSIYKGGYEDTMTAGIAAFRAGQQPDIIQVFDAGAATIINAPGAVYPVADLLKEHGVGFDVNKYISGVRYFYADSDGKMIGMPFNSSTPCRHRQPGKSLKPSPRNWWKRDMSRWLRAIAPGFLQRIFIPVTTSKWQPPITVSIQPM